MTHGQVEDGHGLELPVPFPLGFKALGMVRTPGSCVQHCQLAFLPALATREHLEQVNTTWDTAILSLTKPESSGGQKPGWVSSVAAGPDMAQFPGSECIAGAA